MKRRIVNYSNNKCEDEYFGTIKYNNSNWEWDSNNTRTGCYKSKTTTFLDGNKAILVNNLKNNSNSPIIILLLESPHCNEFDINGKPICPANGTSGKALYDYFCTIINNQCYNLTKYLKSSNCFDVYIVNSIQNQCSLGIKPICNLIKETNWIDEWKNNDLMARINKIINNRDYIVINLCTKGVYISMSDIVREELLNNNISPSKYCVGPHPSSWSRKQYKIKIKNK